MKKSRKQTRRSTWRACLLFFTVLAASCGSDVEPLKSQFDLVPTLQKATVDAPNPDYVVAQPAALGGQEKPALFMHPPSSVEFPAVHIEPSTTIVFAIGLQDTVVEKPGDGVDFTISVRLPDGAVSEVWSKYLDTRVNASDRGWQSMRVSLEKFAGQTVKIILSTSSGPAADNRFDWAFWGDPRTVVGIR